MQFNCLLTVELNGVDVLAVAVEVGQYVMEPGSDGVQIRVVDLAVVVVSVMNKVRDVFLTQRENVVFAQLVSQLKKKEEMLYRSTAISV